jgi:hypothetical protein
VIESVEWSGVGGSIAECEEERWGRKRKIEAQSLEGTREDMGERGEKVLRFGG